MVKIFAAAIWSCSIYALAEHVTVDSEGHAEDDASMNSLCLLQKDLSMNVPKAHYDGPYLDPKGLDKWEKDYIDDVDRGPIFKDSVGRTTTVEPSTSRLPESALPVDSVKEPAPVPAPAASREFQDWWHSLSWSAALFGLIALGMLLFHLMNLQSHRGLQATVQTTVSNVGAVFIAKLLFASFSLFTAAFLEHSDFFKGDDFFNEMPSKDAHHEIYVVGFARAGIIYVLTQGLIYFICYSSCYNEGAVMYITSIGTPLIGFALVDAFGTRLRLSDTSDDFEEYVLVAVFCALVLAAFLALHAVLKRNRVSENFFGTLADDVQGSSQEHYKQDSLDLENTCFSMVAGFLVFKVAERKLLGQPTLARGPLGTQSIDEIASIAIVGLALVGCTFVVSSLRSDFWSIWRESLVRGSCLWYLTNWMGIHPRIIDWMEGTCWMGSAWCFSSTISWAVSSGYFQRGLLQTGFVSTSLFAAFAASIAVLILSLIVGIFVGAGGPPQLHHQGSSHRYSHWLLLSAIGLLGGIAWANCFIHAARDLALNFPVHKQLMEGILCCALALFISPAWALLILPARKPAGDEVGSAPKSSRALLGATRS